MQNTVVRKDGYKYKWTVRGQNETPCVRDIERNGRTGLTDYVATMFNERYGCVAEVVAVREMTHNQYQEFLADNASRLYANEGYTIADFKRDADSVDVLSFDLTLYKERLSDSAIQAINDLLTRERTSRLGNLLLEGHGDDDFIRLLAYKLDCDLVCDHYYNGFYKNDKSWCVMEFCEGDVYLILCPTVEAYRAEVESSNKFYGVEEALDVFGVGESVVPFQEGEEVRTAEDDNARIDVYFDGVHMDSVYVSMADADKMIITMAQYGYDDYNADVKEDWERNGGRPNPDLSFKVVAYPERSVAALIADANERSALTNGKDSKDVEYVK